MPFQDSRTPDGFYDVVIGNWPFENTVISDRRYDKLSPFLHDYFFLKAVDQVRPGGIVMGITSSGTMDKKATGIRRALAKNAELVAAYRLPSGAFQENAGTKVVTDIVILRKRAEPEALVDKTGWIDSVPMKTPSGETVSVNEYFAAHPDHVLGTIDFGSGTTRGRPGMIVHKPDDLAERLQHVAASVPEGIYAPATNAKTISFVANHTADREGALTKTDKGLFVVRGEQLAPAADVRPYAVKDAAETRSRVEQLERLVDLRQKYGALIDAERTDNAEPARKALKQAYDGFVKAHGALADSFGLSWMKRIDDPFYAPLAALEIDGKPAAVLSRSTTRGKPAIENPSIADAFVLERNASVNPSIDAVARHAGVSTDEARAELVKSGAVFELAGGDVIPAEMYLSGNVREKLRQAKAAVAEGMEQLQRNVDALERVVPADVPYFKIETQLGATWVNSDVYRDFIGHMLGLADGKGIDVRYSSGRWSVRVEDRLKSRPEAASGYGTTEYSFQRLVNAAFSNQAVTIRRKDSEGTSYVDHRATEEVNNKISEMRTKFADWLWSDPERRVAMEREYNEVRNAYATPKFDGSFLRFEGMALSLGNGPFDLRQHQADAIWRALVSRRSLNAHEVGTGKTFTIGGIAVESRRYGIARKPLILAHNANSKTVAAEIQQMYPAAKILYIDNLSPQTIDVKMRQIANDDWDAVVVPHSLIDRFSFREETLMDMAREDIAALEEEAYAAAAEDGTTLKPEMLDDPEALKKLRSPTAKELVKMRQRIVETIKKQSNRASREGAIPFEDLGVDMLMVDEAHEFKKPTISTRMQMKGLNTQTSDRSIALQFLTRYVRANNNGGNVHLFTGTPITNTLTEVFHMMRYIMSEEMQHAGVDQWDGWFGSFAREVMDVEQNAAAEYEAVTRLAGFINVPELRRMIGQYMDVVFADDMPEMQPRRTATGKTMTDDLTEKERAELLNGRTENASDRPYKRVVNVTADLTPQQKVIFDELRGYARAWREMSGKERRDAMATGRPESPIITEGLAAKASFDVRLMNGDELAGKEGQTYDDPGSKASRVVDNVKRIYDWHPKTTQVIFAEQGFSNRVTRSLGRDDAGNRQTTTVPAFSTIRDITDRLVQAGIPRDQIEIVDGSTSKDKRKEIAQKMNAAKVRVVIGSTATLGVGVNMQKNLRAMHHMDAPWMPGDLEQRNGRGLRQGNQWNTVEEYRYLTDRLDGRRWQVLAIKQRFITAFLKADDSTRTIEGDAASDDQSDILQSFAEAAGDPRILIREKIRKQLDGAQRRERLYTQGVANALGQARRLSESADEAQAELDDIAAKGTVAKADAIVADNAGKSFSAEVDGTHYDKRADADAAIDDYAANNIRVGDEPRAFGSFGGHPLRIGWPSFEKSARISLELDGRTFGGRTMQGLEQSLRGFSADTERKRQQVEERRASIQRLRALADEPFHMAGDLTRYQTALDALEADIKANPVPPPAWLRAGAPVDTDVVWRGEPFTVTGHRWNAEGWYVLAEDAKGEVSIPYTEAKDAQGLSLYDERPFERPEVVEAKTSTPKQDPANVVADEAEPAAHSIGAQHGGGFVSTEGLRQHLEQSPFGQAVKTLIDSGRIVLHDGADTLGQGKASKAPAKRGPDPERTIAVVPAGSVPEGDNFGQRRGRTQALAREQFAGKRFHNEDQDRDITVPSSAIKHSLDGKRDDDSLAAALAIPDLLREAVLVHSEPNNRGDGTKHDFFAAARIADGSIRRIKIAVVERPDGMMMYSQHIVLPHHPVVEGVPGSGAKGIGKPILAGEPDTAENVRNDRSTVKVVPGSEIGPGDMSPSLGQPGTGIKLRDLLQGVKNPNGSRIFMSKGEGVQGMTSADGRIHLVASNLTSRTAVPVLLHEMFHAGVEPLVGEKAWGNLITRLGSIYDSAVAREATADRSNTAFWRQAIERVDAAGVAPGQEAEEMAAYAIEHYAEAPAGIRSIVDRIVGTVKAWALRRFGVQAGAVTPAQLQSLAVAALRSETIVQRQGQDWSSIRSYFSRVVPTEEEVDTATPGLIHGLVTKAMDGKTSVLGAIPLRPLLQEMASGIPAAQDYLGLKQQMDQFRDSWHAQADAVAQPWLKYRMLHRAENVALMDLMHEATLAQVDPAEPFRSALTKLDRQILSEGPGTDAYDAAAAKLERENARQADHSRLQPIFDALSDTAKTIYRSVRDSYVELSDEFEKTLIANLSKALDIKANQAERAYDAEVMRIHSSAMDRAARDKAVALADKDYQRAKQIQGWSKGARMTRLRAYFETHNLEGPYFPLARFGNFFVTVRDGNDHVISFSRFESPRQQNRFAAEMRRAGHSVETGVLDDGGDLRKQIDARFVADVESILEDADVSDQVRDAVWQRWLESMPDMSIRTSRIHRKGRAGFTSDALRAFGSHMFHGAHQLARLKYALDLDESIALARDQAKTMRDPVRAGLIVNELVRRHQFVMNPTGGPLAQILNAAGYVYFLAASPAAALVNTTQTAIMGVPTLAAYDGRAVGGAARASAELVKAMRDFAAGKGHAANAKSLTDDERAAMEKAYASGLIERTQSHDLAGVADSGVAYSPVRTKVMAAISWAFHNTERFNREVTFLAGYRMARKKGEPQSHAIDTAARLTWQTHFDYQNTSRPRAMQGDTAKVLFAFRNFNANMLWRLFRDVHESVKGGTAQERREALIQLAGTTGMMMVSAGIRGTWFFGIAMLLAKSLFGDDAEDEFTKAIIAGLGHRLGGMALNGVPGSLLGIDLSDRIGMPDLWFRSPDRQLEGQQQFDYWALQLLGANIGAARNIWTGASMIGDGNVYRGVETIAPKFVKDLMRSYRYVTEGARDLKGDVVMDKMGAGNAIRQALGFTPIELTERYDRNRSMKNREQRILDERRGILSDMDEALRDGADTSPIEQRMDTFNTANPDYPVTVRSIMQSRRSSERMRQARAGGVYINPKLAPRLADEAPPLIYADDDGGGE
jgi:N12 class adenine-specific DNA methylase